MLRQAQLLLERTPRKFLNNFVDKSDGGMFCSPENPKRKFRMSNSNARTGISIESKFSFWLKTVERIIVIVAGVAAILPLWQFWSEAGQRELERNSTFILAHQACQELINELIEEEVGKLYSIPGLTG